MLKKQIFISTEPLKVLPADTLEEPLKVFPADTLEEPLTVL